MHRRGNRIDESLIRIRCKIHRDLRSRRNRPGHLNIQRHLAVRAIWIPRRVRPSIHRHRHHRRRFDAQSPEVRRDVARRVPAAQLDEPDRLPCPIHPGRKVVQRRDLRRIEGCRLCGGSRLLLFLQIFQVTKVSPRNRPRIQPQHRFHQPREAVITLFRLRVFVIVQLDAERLLHRLRGPAQHQRPPRKARRRLIHGQPLFVRKPTQCIKTGRIRRELRIEILARDSLPRQRVQVQRVLPFHDDRNAEHLLRVGPSDLLCVGGNAAFGTGQHNALLSGGTHGLPPRCSAILSQNRRRSGQRQGGRHNRVCADRLIS